MKQISIYCIYFVFIVLLTSVLFDARSSHGQENFTDTTNKKILVVIHPYKTATLSAEVSSVVKKINYEMGEQFKKGDALIDFDPALYLADKTKADALLISAKAIYQTYLKLHNQKSVSKIEFSRAEADLQVAKANVDIAKKKLAACSIRAPYHGRVVKLFMNENELVQHGQLLIEIVEDHTMRAKFLVPAFFWEHIKIDQILDVNVGGVGKKFKCKITHISPVMESNTSTFQVFAEIDNSRNILRGGMTGEIELKSFKGK